MTDKIQLYLARSICYFGDNNDITLKIKAKICGVVR